MTRLRKKASGGWSVRLRYGEGEDTWFPLNVDPGAHAVADDRRKRLQRIADLLKRAGKLAESRAILEQAASERSEKGFRNIEAVVESFSPEPAAPEVLTVRKLVDLWVSGELHERYPDDVEPKTPAGRDNDRAMLSTFFPAIGDKPVARLVPADIDAAKALIPKGSASSTRALYARRLRFVLRLAVKPLRAVESVPEVSIPKSANRFEFTFLYPEEEAKLSRCLEIPFEYRFLYAFLARNGTRISETLQITWDHVDLEMGIVHMDRAWTKTGKTRYFELEPDVLRALKVRRTQMQDAALVFTGPGNRPLTRKIRWRFQADLERAGITRPEAIGKFSDIRALTIHDLRASFATLARRRGMKERWIRDHTGHESPSQLDKYERFVQRAEQLKLGWFEPMWQVLGLDPSWNPGMGPTGVGHSGATGPYFAGKTVILSLQHGVPEDPLDPENQPKTPVDAASTGASGPRGPAEKSILGQGVAQVSSPPDTPIDPGATDPARTVEWLQAETLAALVRIEESLAEDLKALIAAQRFELADKVMAELRERRLQRTAPEVRSLEQKRREKGEGK